jgi:2-polyprenyl-3-methyl-5-hydroxy-6-metoxy-1,4-benzoquinol methylase
MQGMNKDAKSTNGLCPVCLQTDITKFVTIDEVPVHCNVLRSIRKEAVNAKRAELVLAYCRHCSHIFNLAFEPDQMGYEQQYENSLHYSLHFKDYALSLAKRLVKTYNLHRKTIMEIGCGQGDFLKMLCEIGDNCGIGFDPSSTTSRLHKRSQGQVSIIKDYYSEKYIDCQTDFLVCRHVLEHIDSPRSFLRMVRSTVGSNAGAPVFFEVPNIEFTLRERGIWDLIYEHCSYYSQASLSYLFSSCDFKIHNIEAAFGDQTICLEASSTSNSSDLSRQGVNKKDNLESLICSFSDRYQQKVNHWQQKVKEFENQEKRVVVWGAGSKGISFLNQIKATRLIKYIIDVNPHKFGKFIAGGGQEIMAPEFLKEYRPDVVVVMNPNYGREIRQYIHEMGLSPKLLAA